MENEQITLSVAINAEHPLERLGYRVSTHNVGQSFQVLRYRFCPPSSFVACGPECLTEAEAWKVASDHFDARMSALQGDAS